MTHPTPIEAQTVSEATRALALFTREHHPLGYENIAVDLYGVSNEANVQRVKELLRHAQQNALKAL